MSSPTVPDSGDFYVLEDVCVTLHSCAERLEDSIDWRCVLNACIAATQNPHLAEEKRTVLYRLADLLSISASHTWEMLSGVEGESGRTLYIPCYVPPRSETAWADMGMQPEENAQEFGKAATYLRFFQTAVPNDGLMLRCQSWIHIAQESLSVAGQMLRRDWTAAPSSLEAEVA